MLRRGIAGDFVYVVLNGHFLGLGLALISRPLERHLAAFGQHWGFSLHGDFAREWPWPVQLTVAFFAVDFVQWLIHNLMHRVPWFWEFHKVHHSIEALDWLGSLKFHWMEIVLYKSLQYPLMALLGFGYPALFMLAIASTFIGHYNHSNFGLNLGPGKFFLNGPEMHEWHHVHPDAGPTNRNFGINLSLWDWLFGTAYLPASKASPSRLGFSGMENFPRNIALQEAWPLSGWLGKPSKGNS